MVCPVILNQDKYTWTKDYKHGLQEQKITRTSRTCVTEITLIFDQSFLGRRPIREWPTYLKKLKHNLNRSSPSDQLFFFSEG